MDFFAAQDHARRNTGWLVFYFLLAVLSLIALTNLLTMAALGALPFDPLQPGPSRTFNWKLFFCISSAVIILVAGGTYYKISALSRGGDAVAAMFGAEPIFADDTDLTRQKLLHVVEEMAIASGTPVPQIYVLQERGINAFAAGFTTSDAVIAVTEGAMNCLNREQLQGVIAHEFSHILNGDMRLNIRLVGVLHGILLIGLIGNQILRGSGGSGSSRRGGAGGLLFGLGLIVIGYTGTFFGKLIKSAVSRQREFLADSSAVQFTRNPDGIGGALLKIGAHQHGSLVSHVKSDELSHAFFSQGVAVTFTALFATHPPLKERIRRILPGWDGVFPKEMPFEKRQKVSVPIHPSFTGDTVAGLAANGVMQHIGRPRREHLLHAQQLLQNIPEVLKKAAGDPFACRALLLYLVLDPDEEIRNRQLQQIKATADRGIYPELLRLLRADTVLHQEQRLPVVELALPSLRRLSREQCRQFVENLHTLMRTDGKISLFEWCLYKIVTQQIEGYFGKSFGQKQGNGDLRQSIPDCGVVISALVNATRHLGPSVTEVFAAAAREMGVSKDALTFSSRFSLKDLGRSLNVLKRLSPQAKNKLIRACAMCVVADGRIEPAEAELLRAIAACLSVPVPPIPSDQG